MGMVQQNAHMGALKRVGEAPGVWPPTSLRVKRSMLAGRRIVGGPSTPVPRWKLYENPFYDGIAAAAAAAAQQQSASGGGRNVPVSARKLAATLWELQELPRSLAASKSSPCPCAQYTQKVSIASTAVTARKSLSQRDHLLALAADSTKIGPLNPSPEESPRHSSNYASSQAGEIDAELSKETMASLGEAKKGWENGKKNATANSRQVAAMRSHVHRLLERRADSRLAQIASASASPASLMVLNRIRGMEEQQQAQPLQQEQQLQVQHHPHPQQQSGSAPASLVASLRMEVERARTRVHELELAQKSARREIDGLVRKMGEEKVMFRNKEQEKVKAAVQAVKAEMEEEKKLRRRVESVNRKMSRELVEANLAVAKAVQELERERKARELMEDVCDELAREIGEDKAEVEELKRESARIRDEVEEERKMLQMAEVWREERVQMKLSEARHEIEEKASQLDDLKIELEAFLNSRKAFGGSFRASSHGDEASVRDAEDLKMAMDSLASKEAIRNMCRTPESEDAASDLYDVETIGNAGDAREKPDWGWGAKPSTRWDAAQGHAAELDHKLESREQVLERLRRKYSDQTGLLHQTHLQSCHKTEGNVEASARQWEEEEEYASDPLDTEGASEWNSQSDGGAPGDDAKDEDCSQWESASDQDIEVLQSITSCSRGGADELRGAGGPDAAPAALSGGYESISSQTSYNNIINNNNFKLQRDQQHAVGGGDASSGDDLWRSGSSPPTTARKVLNEDKSSRGEAGSRNSLGRGMVEVSRSAHMRMASEQGIASPSRDWRSPDRGNPHIARGIKGFIEWPKMSRENGVKGKVLDSKLEKSDRRALRQNT